MLLSSDPALGDKILLAILAYLIATLLPPISVVLLVIAKLTRGTGAGWAKVLGVTGVLNLVGSAATLALLQNPTGRKWPVLLQAAISIGLLIVVSRESWRVAVFGPWWDPPDA